MYCAELNSIYACLSFLMVLTMSPTVWKDSTSVSGNPDAVLDLDRHDEADVGEGVPARDLGLAASLRG